MFECETNCEKVHKYPTGKLRYFLALIVKIITISVLISCSVLASSENNAPTTLSTAAEYIRDIKLPGSMNGLLRPARILIDQSSNEIYLVDQGNSRIVILDQNGVFKFEFYTSQECGAPSDLAFDAEGYFYVLGSTVKGRDIFVYDFNGEFLRAWGLDSRSDSPIYLTSIASDGHGKLYGHDERNHAIVRLALDGSVEQTFLVAANLDEKERGDLVCGSLTISQETIYLPIGSLGMVYRFDFDGRELSIVGFKGSNIGELNFPVAVAVTADNIIMVLDKHRFTVVCFSENGQFLGEFGGMGVSPGWFYHPTWLAVDAQNQIYIGQIFNNKVQLCRIPDFIIERLHQLTDCGGAPYYFYIEQNEPVSGSAMTLSGLLENKLFVNFMNLHFTHVHGGFSHA